MFKKDNKGKLASDRYLKICKYIDERLEVEVLYEIPSLEAEFFASFELEEKCKAKEAKGAKEERCEEHLESSDCHLFPPRQFDDCRSFPPRQSSDCHPRSGEYFGEAKSYEDTDCLAFERRTEKLEDTDYLEFERRTEKLEDADYLAFERCAEKIENAEHFELEKRDEVVRRLKKSIAPKHEKAKKEQAMSQIGYSRRSLDDVILEQEESFSDSVLRLIDEKGLKDSQVYKRANIDRRLFSKIRSDIDYRPSKNTAIAMAVALELEIDKALDLIGKAGFTLSFSNKFDLIVRYFIEERNYDIFEINDALYEFEQQVLC